MTADPVTQVPAARPMERGEVTAPAAAYGNPVPLGLFAYGMPLVVLSLANIGYYPVDAMVLAMVLVFGGIAQLVVSVLTSRRADTFGMTVFGGLGFFYLTYGFMLIGSQHGWWSVAAGTTAIGWYLVTWAVFALAMAVASVTVPPAITAILTLSAALLAVLAIATWNDTSSLVKFAGWWGLATAALSIYTAFGLLTNDVLGRNRVPLGAPIVRARTASAATSAAPPRPRTYAD